MLSRRQRRALRLLILFELALLAPQAPAAVMLPNGHAAEPIVTEMTEPVQRWAALRVEKLCSLLPWLGGYGSASSTGYQIARAIRIRGSNTGYFSKTLGAPSTAGIFTLSFWLKPASLGGASRDIFSAVPASLDGNYSRIFLSNDDKLYVYTGTGAGPNTTRVFRDPTAWCHVCIGVDLTSGASDRVRVEVNLVSETMAGTQPTQNSTCYFNVNTNPHAIGQLANYINQQFDGMLAEFYFIDGQRLSASNFVALDAATNSVQPKAYTGTYGNNGFYLKFADNSAATAAAIGKDSSGNGNNWTPTNISVTAGITNDSLVDTPTNYGTDTGAGGEVRGNYPYYNPVDPGYGGTISNAGMKVAWTGALTQTCRVNRPLPTSGKWYWEVYIETDSNTNGFVGICTAAATQTSSLGLAANGWSWNPGGRSKNIAGSTSTWGATHASNGASAWYGFYYDADNDSLYCRDATGWNNATTNTDATPLTAMVTGLPKDLFPASGYSSGGAQSVTHHFNGGQWPFQFGAPTGAKALSTQNLPDPTIKLPRNYMDINTRTGTGAAFNVTGKAFQPDLVWSKGRSGATAHARYDSSRGATIDMDCADTPSETTQSTGVTSFNSDGFSGGALAKLNTSAATYVDWLFKKGSVPGFDIVSYTGDGTSPRNINHSLGAVPSVIWVNPRSGSGEQQMKHVGMTANNVAWPGITNQQQTSPAFGIINDPTSSSTFTVAAGGSGATNVNTNGNLYTAYLWAEVAGFSKFGKYTGNGSADGPFAYCGFRPRWILIKRIDSTSNWYIYDSVRDTYNALTDELLVNAVNAEANNSRTIDFLATGFKVRNSDAQQNASGGTYIFMAFADSPLKYARAA